jgi:hypothetical protein
MGEHADILQLFDSILNHGNQQFLQRSTRQTALSDSVEFTLANRRFICRTSLNEYRHSILNGLVNCDPAQTSYAEVDCSIAIGIAGEDGWPDLPGWAERRMQDPELHLALESTPYRFLQQPPGCWQFFDRRLHCGVQLLRSPTSLPAWDGGAPLRNFLHWHLISNSCGLLHAGSLGHDGQGILLAGPGGSGKSGTVLAGLLHGLQSVGDDYVLVRMDEGIRAYPLFQTLKQDPGGCERIGIPANSPLRRSLNWQGKHQFRLADLGGKEPADSLKIHALCLPTISGAASTRFLPVEGKEAFLALAPSGMAQMPGDRGTLFGFCATVARSLPTYRLELGSDPAEISASIHTFLQDWPR